MHRIQEIQTFVQNKSWLEREGKIESRERTEVLKKVETLKEEFDAIESKIGIDIKPITDTRNELASLLGMLKTRRN